MTDKKSEYQQVAALVCGDIDVILTAAEQNPDMALDLLKRLKGMKDKVISDKEHREMRFAAAQTLYSLSHE